MVVKGLRDKGTLSIIRPKETNQGRQCSGWSVTQEMYYNEGFCLLSSW